MKINGTGPGSPPLGADVEPAAAEQTPGAARTEGGSGTQASEKLSSSAQASLAESAPQAGRAPEMKHVVADLSADLKAGRLSPEAAVDQLLDRVLDGHVGKADTGLRQQLAASLRSQLAEDPFLGAHFKALSKYGKA